jgi:hypothetical protein
MIRSGDGMRTLLLAAVACVMLAGTVSAQPAGAPPVQIITPLPAVQLPPSTPVPPVLPKLPEPPVLPRPEFGVDPMPGTVVSPAVRPPMPVEGPGIEVPPGPRVWVDFECLMWRAKGGLVPAVVAAAYAVPTQPTPDPWTAFMINDNRINGDIRSGMRLSAGYWLDKPQGTGVEARYTRFLHADDIANYTGSSETFLARPFWDESRDVPALFLLSNPNGTMQGIAQVRTSFDSQGFEANYWRRGPAMFAEQFHWIFGLRYWELEEDLTVAAGSQSGGLQVATYDTFATRNQFFGGQIGGKLNYTMNRFTIDFILKLAVGAMVQDATISGGSMAVLPTGTIVDRQGGFLALASNMGEHSRTKMAFIRDTTINVGYCVTDYLTLRLGLDFSYVYQVVRPGEQIDLGINPNLLPFSPTPAANPARPGFRFNQEDFWMYGVNFGVSLQF